MSLKNKYTEYPKLKTKKSIHQIENPWVSSVQKKKEFSDIFEYKRSLNLVEEISGKLRGDLNKLTAANFDIICNKILGYKITEDFNINIFTDIIYNKCISDIKFVKLYASLIKEISNKYPAFFDTFISLCNNTHKNWNNINNNDDDDFLKKRKIINNLCLTGELFNNDLLSSNIISDLTYELLTNEDKRDFGIELMCNLLPIVGNKFNMVNRKHMSKCINKLQELSKMNISSKNRFNIMDINDMYENLSKSCILNKKEESHDRLAPKHVDAQSNTKYIETSIIEYIANQNIDIIKENLSENSNKEFIEILFDIYINESIKNKNNLVELIDDLIKKKLISNLELNDKISSIKNEIDKYEIDYPHINKDIDIIEQIIKPSPS
jgi:hypothetical protein